MNLLKINSFAVIALLTLCLNGCSSATGGIALPVGKKADRPGLTTGEFESSIESVREIVIHGEGDLSEISRVIGVDGDDLFVSDRESIARVSLATGEVQAVVNRTGRGPGEYLGISSASISAADKLIAIATASGKKGLLFNYDLECVKELDSRFTGGVHSNGEAWFVPVSPFVEDAVAYYSWSRDFMSSTPGNVRRTPVESEIVNYDRTSKVGEDIYYKKAYNDTVYVVRNGVAVPFVFLDSGSKTWPLEYYADLSLSNSEAADTYIRYSSICMVGRYLSVSYYYDNKIHYDLWNPETKELVLRNVASESYPHMGLPLQVGGRQVFAIPEHTTGDTAFFTYGETEQLSDDDAMRLIIVRFKK